MNNCQTCKYRKSLFNKLVGCAKYKKIILSPYEVKNCYEPMLGENDLISQLFTMAGA